VGVLSLSLSLCVCVCVRARADHRENEQGMTLAQWPGLPSKEFSGHHDAHYTEGQIVGYRFYASALRFP
jgi:hypothetical protein